MRRHNSKLNTNKQEHVSRLKYVKSFSTMDGEICEASILCSFALLSDRETACTHSRGIYEQLAGWVSEAQLVKQISACSKVFTASVRDRPPQYITAKRSWRDTSSTMFNSAGFNSGVVHLAKVTHWNSTHGDPCADKAEMRL